MANPYPFDIKDDAGSNSPVKLSGVIDFTDSGNQPGTGLPDGWTQTGDPADVSMEGGQLAADSGANVTMGADGFFSAATDTCFTATNDEGATVALDAGALPITNLPTSDPGIAGALWNSMGTPAISTG